MQTPAIEFAKLCCGGNDFIVIDARKSLPFPDPAAAAKEICQRRSGVGADGLILLVKDKNYPFKMKLFNSDGSCAEVSYNGSRCVGLYAVVSELTENRFEFNSDAGVVKVQVDSDLVTLEVPPPKAYQLNINLQQEGAIINANHIIAGVPYLLIPRSNLITENLEVTANSLKTHTQYPEGTNVAVYEPAVDSVVQARFFERGVKEETPSSGSGCVAAALIESLSQGTESPITVRTAGGDFVITFQRSGDVFSHIRTAGKVSYCFSGKLRDLN